MIEWFRDFFSGGTKSSSMKFYWIGQLGKISVLNCIHILSEKVRFSLKNSQSSKYEMTCLGM